MHSVPRRESAVDQYKPFDTQPKLIPVDLAAQLFPGTFEHALHHVLQHTIDLPPFDARYRRVTTGAPAYPMAIRSWWTPSRRSVARIGRMGIDASQPRCVARGSA